MAKIVKRKMATKPSSSILRIKSTVVGDYINILKTIFNLNIDLYQAFKQHGIGYRKTWKQREVVNKKAFL